MHFGCVVIYRKRQNPETRLAEHRGQWDWYQRGGRYTGFFTDYEPGEDPANRRPCTYCEATGNRFGAPGDCNACHGTGIYTEWPTNWVPYEFDDVGIESWPEDRAPYCAITPESEWTSPWPDECRDSGREPTPEEWAAARARIQAWKSQYAGCRVRIYDLHY